MMVEAGQVFMVRLMLVSAAVVTFTTACGGGGGSPSQPTQPTCTPVTTSTLPLRAGETFRVRFRVPTGLTREIVILTYLGLPETGFNSSSISHRLYDGTTLLGTQAGTGLDTTAIWKSPESTFGTPGDTAYGLSAPAVSVDFSSIVAGTIDGRVDLSVTAGSAVISSANEAEVVLMGPVRSNFPDTRASITARESCR